MTPESLLAAITDELDGLRVRVAAAMPDEDQVDWLIGETANAIRAIVSEYRRIEPNEGGK
jgi:hypothetical protein